MFFFHFINISSFFLNLDNIIIKLVNVRGTMQKEAEVNLAYILACESQISFFFFRPTWDPYNSDKLTSQIYCHMT